MLSYSCTVWIDLELEYSTRKTLAVQSQKCAIKSLFSGGFKGLSECLQGPMIGGTHGFSEGCANCWAEDIFCTKKHCIFLYLQSKMTNKVGNFKVGPNDITWVFQIWHLLMLLYSRILTKYCSYAINFFVLFISQIPVLLPAKKPIAKQEILVISWVALGLLDEEWT